MLKKLFSKLLILVVILISSTAMLAQGVDVTGIVTDAGDGTPLPGATIVVKGTTQGTVSDINGIYTIGIETGQVLVFSYVGYAMEERKVDAASSVNVSLKSSALSLDGVVVIGYGVAKKKDVTGSVTAIESESFNSGAITNPASLIAGKVAGVQISSNGGAPGTSSSIIIRGGSSLSASNEPLYVIDGIPISNDAGGGTRSPLNSINPNDIASFTILKDASATAIYGSRASNGVIIITTKRGKIGRPLQLEYQGVFSFYQIPNTLSINTSDEFVSLINDKEPSYVDMLGTWTDPNGNPIVYNDLPDDRTGYNQTIHKTNWQDEIYENTMAMDHNITATGAWQNMPYRFSVGYTDQPGIVKTSKFQRTTIAASLNPTLLNDNLNVNFNVNASFIKNQFSNGGAINSALQMDPTKPVNSSDNSYGGYWAWLQSNGDPVVQGTKNPMALLNLTDNKSDANRVFGNLQLDYRMPFLPELKANMNLSMDYSKNKGHYNVPNYAPWSYNKSQGGGSDNHYNNEHRNMLGDFYFSYAKDVESIKSNFDVTAGYSIQYFYDYATSDNSNIPVIIDPVTGDSTGQEFITEKFESGSEYYLESVFGRLNYILNNKYLLTASVRQDGSTRFAPKNRNAVFPAVALGWKINEEAFLRDSKAITQLKLRLGWGVTGQQAVQGAYDYLGRYTFGNEFASYPFGNTYYITLRPDGYNEDLKWEQTTTWNAGLDYAFLNNRIYGSVDYYVRQTTNLLSYVPVPAGSNLSNYITKNIGDLENRGVEFSINGKVISKPDMYWELGFNATFNKNEITNLYDGAMIETGGIAGGVGNNIQVQAVGQPRNTFYVYEQVYDESGMPIEGLYVDRNGDGQITTDDKYFHNSANPDKFFGISSNFSYKSWSFAFSGRANFGNYMYNNVQSDNGWYGRLYRAEGPYISNITTGVSETGFQNAHYFSDYYIQDAAFFRMDNISLSYLFKDLAKNTLDIRLSATVNNAFIITNYSGIDPEVNGGIDNGVYPRTRVWVFGVNLMF
ncbi:MAG: TonB-dependent receptor [Bacteroidales bacterium]|jgi:TonB-linked SusC/RagA family outer membrane protein|nr:TonB-dependent receptor [Bacteroidales bacterium]MDG2081839.1 TonB-dependent receptor [Bacteroidales bacterium]